jgi:nucleoid DNA-binding protein
MAAKKKAAKKKAVARKAPARKTAAKKKVAAKAAPAPRKIKAIADPMSKTQILNNLSESTGLTRKQVGEVLDGLTDLIEGHLKKRGGAGTFTMPGLMKIVTKKKPATKARKGVNPFTGEPTMIKAKPASVQVRVRPLKKMKDMAQ